MRWAPSPQAGIKQVVPTIAQLSSWRGFLVIRKSQENLAEYSDLDELRVKNLEFKVAEVGTFFRAVYCIGVNMQRKCFENLHNL